MDQMAQRCPSSLFMGKGRIDGYIWQINDRGVANIIESGKDFVEGLVYQIENEDKRRLDRNEGVARGFYTDERLYTQLSASPHRGIKTFHVAKEIRRDDRSDPERKGPRREILPETSSVRPKQSSQPPSRHPKQENSAMVEALVYVSHEYNQDGHIRPEYMERMEQAITDGRKMGLTSRYLNHINRVIHREAPTSSYNAASRTNNELSETLGTTRSISARHERGPSLRPSFLADANVITVRPRNQDFHDPNANCVDMGIENRYEQPYRPNCDARTHRETQQGRRDRSPPGSRQSRGKGRWSGAGSFELVTRRYYDRGRLVHVIERRERSRSTPY